MNIDNLRFLSSVRVGLVLLSLLVVASIVGTLIDPLERAQRLVYYSWWYETLLLALALNLACATVRMISERAASRAPSFIRKAPFYTAQGATAVPAFKGVANEVAEALRRRGFKASTDGDWGVATRGTSNRWGAPISHVGVIIVLLSGFATQWVAMEGVVSLYEGQSAEAMVLSGDASKSVDLGFTLRCEDFDTAFFPKTRIPAHFITTVVALDGDEPFVVGEVEVNRSLAVRGWTLHQTSYEEVPGLTRYLVSVGHSDLTTTLSLEISPGQRRMLAGLNHAAENDVAQISLDRGRRGRWTIHADGRHLGRGSLFTNPSVLRLRAERFEPDFIIGHDRKVGSRSQELNNPALLVNLYDGDRVVDSQWLFAREDLKGFMRGAHGGDRPYRLDLVDVVGAADDWTFHVSRLTTGPKAANAREEHWRLKLGEEAVLDLRDENGRSEDENRVEAAGGFDVRFEREVPAYQTVLTLTRNPALPVIYGGCALITIGMAMAFFISRRQVWFWADRDANTFRIVGRYRPARVGLDRATRAALDSLSMMTRRKASDGTTNGHQ